MSLSRVVEYVFFFALLAISGYMVWLIAAPFLSALALAAMIVTISSPLYTWLRPRMPKQSKSAAAFLSTIIVFLVGILPIVLMTTLIINEVVDLYQSINRAGDVSFGGTVELVEEQVRQYVPEFELNIAEQLGGIVEWFTGNLASIFAGTLSTFFLFFIALIGSFYFFRDGQELLQVVIKASPLPDHEDEVIFRRMATAVRGVAMGTLLVAIIQGIIATIGFLIAGTQSAILLGGLVAIAAMIPGLGTGVVMIPVALLLIFSGNVFGGIFLLCWAAGAVGLIDNFLGPYLMSRNGTNMHPFIILISVLGGISLFGIIGFLVGPVVVTLFLVLLEIYNQYIVQDQRITDLEDVHDQSGTNRSDSEN